MAAVSRYLAMIDELGADPDAPLEKLTTVARGQTVAQWTQNLFNQRVRGERQVGRVGRR